MLKICWHNKPGSNDNFQNFKWTNWCSVQNWECVYFGQDREEHDVRLEAALTQIKSVGTALNKDKCLYEKEKIQFLDFCVIDKNGTAYPSKVTAITEMKAPINNLINKTLLGMANQLYIIKFISWLATITQPLRELLSKINSWSWTFSQQKAFHATK